MILFWSYMASPVPMKAKDGSCSLSIRVTTTSNDQNIIHKDLFYNIKQINGLSEEYSSIIKNNVMGEAALLTRELSTYWCVATYMVWHAI